MSSPIQPSRHARRRDQQRRRRRALAALLLTGLAALGVGLLVARGGDDGGAGSSRASERQAAAADGPDATAKPPAPAPPPAPELPGGGRRIFPDRFVVGFYGAPQADALGVLGVGPPSRVAAKLRRQAAPYERTGRRILPAFELISTIAQAAPGPDGQYRLRQKHSVIRRYHRAARRAGALLVLDVQPGLDSFMREARALEPFLREPDVSLALDPEWQLQPGQRPSQQIGRTDAATVNRVSAYLQRLVERHRLPQKLLIVHQFTQDMIRDKTRLRKRPDVAVTLNVDGFGGRRIKEEKYRAFTRRPRRFHNGFKLFYEEDTRGGAKLMTPTQVLALRPRPDLVMYE